MLALTEEPQKKPEVILLVGGDPGKAVEWLKKNQRRFPLNAEFYAAPAFNDVPGDVKTKKVVTLDPKTTKEAEEKQYEILQRNDESVRPYPEQSVTYAPTAPKTPVSKPADAAAAKAGQAKPEAPAPVKPAPVEHAVASQAPVPAPVSKPDGDGSSQEKQPDPLPPAAKASVPDAKGPAQADIAGQRVADPAGAQGADGDEDDDAP